MHCQRREYLADIARKSRYPASYYIQHCSPLIAITCPAFVSLELRGLRDLCDLLLLYKVSDAPSLSDFPFLAALPSQFIFFNSRRLLVLDNVTLMRQVRGCAPPGSNLLSLFFFFFCFLEKYVTVCSLK